MIMETSIYSNADITVFGVQFSHCPPIKIIHYFMNKSIFKKYNTIDEYTVHLKQFMDVPDRKEGESDEGFVDRIFQEFQLLGILVVNETIH